MLLCDSSPWLPFYSSARSGCCMAYVCGFLYIYLAWDLLGFCKMISLLWLGNFPFLISSDTSFAFVFFLFCDCVYSSIRAFSTGPLTHFISCFSPDFLLVFCGIIPTDLSLNVLITSMFGHLNISLFLILDMPTSIFFWFTISCWRKHLSCYSSVPGTSGWVFHASRFYFFFLRVHQTLWLYGRHCV